jgi:hypothetical protein
MANRDRAVYRATWCARDRRIHLINQLMNFEHGLLERRFIYPINLLINSRSGKMPNSNKLIIDEKALEELGLCGETIYAIEYDLYGEKNLTPSEKKTLSKEEKAQVERNNKIGRELRNKLVFTLKFKLFATKHLESSWLLDGEHLDEAVSEIEGIKNEFKAKGFADCDKRIKIVPIITTSEGFQHYEDKKAEFVLEFVFEHVKYAETGIKEQKISQSTLWRCKQAVSICNALAEELKGNERYNELVDSINILDELNAQCEAFILEQKEQAKAEKENAKTSKP